MSGLLVFQRTSCPTTFTRPNEKKPFIVAKKNKEGKIRHRCVASVDDAVAFLEDHADANDSGDIGGSEPGSSA